MSRDEEKEKDEKEPLIMLDSDDEERWGSSAFSSLATQYSSGAFAVNPDDEDEKKKKKRRAVIVEGPPQLSLAQQETHTALVPPVNSGSEHEAETQTVDKKNNQAEPKETGEPEVSDTSLPRNDRKETKSETKKDGKRVEIQFFNEKKETKMPTRLNVVIESRENGRVMSRRELTVLLGNYEQLQNRMNIDGVTAPLPWSHHARNLGFMFYERKKSHETTSPLLEIDGGRFIQDAFDILKEQAQNAAVLKNREWKITEKNEMSFETSKGALSEFLRWQGTERGKREFAEVDSIMEKLGRSGLHRSQDVMDLTGLPYRYQYIFNELSVPNRDRELHTYRPIESKG